MRTKHPSDQAFDAWVDGADNLRTHSVQAAFRGGWEAGEDHAGRACPHADEVERYRQRSRDEDTARIRLNHARIEAQSLNAELLTALEAHIYKDGHTVACLQTVEPNDQCDSRCKQARAAVARAKGRQP